MKLHPFCMVAFDSKVNVFTFLQVFRNKLTFFAAAKVSSSFPLPEVPEIAFAGNFIILSGQ